MDVLVDTLEAPGHVVGLCVGKFGPRADAAVAVARQTGVGLFQLGPSTLELHDTLEAYDRLDVVHTIALQGVSHDYLLTVTGDLSICVLAPGPSGSLCVLHATRLDANAVCVPDVWHPLQESWTVSRPICTRWRREGCLVQHTVFVAFVAADRIHILELQFLVAPAGPHLPAGSITSAWHTAPLPNLPASCSDVNGCLPGYPSPAVATSVLAVEFVPQGAAHDCFGSYALVLLCEDCPADGSPATRNLVSVDIALDRPQQKPATGEEAPHGWAAVARSGSASASAVAPPPGPAQSEMECRPGPWCIMPTSLTTSLLLPVRVADYTLPLDSAERSCCMGSGAIDSCALHSVAWRGPDRTTGVLVLSSAAALLLSADVEHSGIVQALSLPLAAEPAAAVALGRGLFWVIDAANGSALLRLGASTDESWAVKTVAVDAASGEEVSTDVAGLDVPGVGGASRASQQLPLRHVACAAVMPCRGVAGLEGFEAVLVVGAASGPSTVLGLPRTAVKEALACRRPPGGSIGLPELLPVLMDGLGPVRDLADVPAHPAIWQQHQQVPHDALLIASGTAHHACLQRSVLAAQLHVSAELPSLANGPVDLLPMTAPVRPVGLATAQASWLRDAVHGSLVTGQFVCATSSVATASGLWVIADGKRDVRQVALSGFLDTAYTLAAAYEPGLGVLQVTCDRVQLIDAGGRGLLAQWTTPSRRIQHACISGCTVAVLSCGSITTLAAQAHCFSVLATRSFTAGVALGALLRPPPGLSSAADAAAVDATACASPCDTAAPVEQQPALAPDSSTCSGSLPSPLCVLSSWTESHFRICRSCDLKELTHAPVHERLSGIPVAFSFLSAPPPSGLAAPTQQPPQQQRGAETDAAAAAAEHSGSREEAASVSAVSPSVYLLVGTLNGVVVVYSVAGARCPWELEALQEIAIGTVHVQLCPLPPIATRPQAAAPQDAASWTCCGSSAVLALSSGTAVLSFAADGAAGGQAGAARVQVAQVVVSEGGEVPEQVCVLSDGRLLWPQALGPPLLGTLDTTVRLRGRKRRVRGLPKKLVYLPVTDAVACQVVDSEASQHSVHLYHPEQLQQVLQLPLAQGHEIECIAHAVLPVTRTQGDSAAPASRSSPSGTPDPQHSRSARRQTPLPQRPQGGEQGGESPSWRGCRARTAASADPSREEIQAEAEDNVQGWLRAATLEGAQVWCPRPAGPEAFVVQEHLLMGSSVYCAKETGPTRMVHLLSIFQPQRLGCSGERLVRYSLDLLAVLHLQAPCHAVAWVCPELALARSGSQAQSNSSTGVSANAKVASPDGKASGKRRAPAPSQPGPRSPAPPAPSAAAAATLPSAGPLMPLLVMGGLGTLMLLEVVADPALQIPTRQVTKTLHALAVEPQFAPPDILGSAAEAAAGADPSADTQEAARVAGPEEADMRARAAACVAERAAMLDGMGSQRRDEDADAESAGLGGSTEPWGSLGWSPAVVEAGLDMGRDWRQRVSVLQHDAAPLPGNCCVTQLEVVRNRVFCAELFSSVSVFSVVWRELDARASLVPLLVHRDPAWVHGFVPLGGTALLASVHPHSLALISTEDGVLPPVNFPSGELRRPLLSPPQALSRALVREGVQDPLANESDPTQRAEPDRIAHRVTAAVNTLVTRLSCNIRQPITRLVVLRSRVASPSAMCHGIDAAQQRVVFGTAAGGVQYVDFLPESAAAEFCALQAALAEKGGDLHTGEARQLQVEPRAAGTGSGFPRTASAHTHARNWCLKPREHPEPDALRPGRTEAGLQYWTGVPGPVEQRAAVDGTFLRLWANCNAAPQIELARAEGNPPNDRHESASAGLGRSLAEGLSDTHRCMLSRIRDIGPGLARHWTDTTTLPCSATQVAMD